MKQLKILGVALMAVFALSAVAASMASAEVKVLPELEEAFKGESGAGTLEMLKGVAVIECAKDKSEGTFEGTKPLGSFHIDFEGCKALKIAACTGLGESAETILSLGTFHLVFDKLGTGAELGVGILFLVEKVHFECGGKLFVVSGEVLCLLTKPLNEKAKHFEIVCKKGKEAGDPGEVVYWNEKGEEVKINEEKGGLLTAVNEGTGVMSSENTSALILTTNNIEIMG
jgi:hypothetical protein